MSRDIEVNWDSIDPERSKLRVLVARVESELAGLQGRSASTGPAPLAGLLSAWHDVVGQLALGAEPLLRSCPHCQRSILDQAVRCRYCMRRSAATSSAP